MQSIPIAKIDSSLDYPIEETANTLLALTEGGFIESTYNFTGDHILYTMRVYRITYSRYQLLESIRPKTVWDKLKNVFSLTGTFLIDKIPEVANEIIIPIISENLNT